MNSKIIVGEVIKPVGIRGQLKIKTYTDTDSAFKALKSVEIDGENYPILQANTGGGAVIYLKGIADRNAAESFRGKLLYAEKSQLPIQKGRYFIDDIIGCKIYTEKNQFKGEVINVTNNLAADIFTALIDGKEVMFPHLKDLVLEVDIAQRKITVSEKRFNETAVEN